MVCAAASDSQGSGPAAYHPREVLDGLMAGPRPGLPDTASGNNPPHLAVRQAMSHAHCPGWALLADIPSTIHSSSQLVDAALQHDCLAFWEQMRI